jgi:membrane protein
MAIAPAEWPALSEWRQVLTRTWKESGDDNVGLLAAGVAFYGFTAFVPLLASVVLTYGLIAEPETVSEHIQTLAKTLPREAAAIVADQLQSISGTKAGAKGLGLLLAIAVAVYGASKGSGAIVTALNVAYEVKETRGFVRRTLLALAMTVGLAAVLLAAALAISALGFVEHLLPFSSPAVHTALQVAFWAAAALLVSVGIALVYRYAPNRPDAPWRWITPGSAAATLVWLLASFGFGLYVSNFGNYNATYGSLGGVVVFLTWLYLTAYILLMGGELNSELERQQAIEAEQAKAQRAAPAPVATASTPPPADSPKRGSAAGKAAAAGAAAVGLAALFRRLRVRRGPAYLRPGQVSGAAASKAPS